MPNWVFNHLSISGDADQIEKVKNQLNKPIEKTYFNREKNENEAVKYSNPIFSFWNIVAPPEDKLEQYFETNGSRKNPETGEMEMTGQSEWNWYAFNNREWGTKWDVAVSDGTMYSDTSLEEDGSNYLRYRFDTAWSPPMSAIQKLSEQYPELTITIEYEEEQGWGGEIELLNGVETVLREWDIPDSHADYVALDREDSCSCAHNEDQDDWYDDCPGKDKPIEIFASRDVIVTKDTENTLTP
jgi:hypothetical protein